MNTAVSVNQITKFFTKWEKKQKDAPGIKGKIFGWMRRKKEKFFAVNSISFKVRSGEIFGILGANGSGKSTLIRLISTLLLPDEGSISVFGMDVLKDSFKVKELISRVSVEAAFFKKLSVLENLAYASSLYGLERAEAQKRMIDILQKLGFPLAKTGDSLEDLSRGLQQKVAICRALLVRPRLLLMDEPTTGLDPKSKKQVQKIIKEINKDYGITIILTTHDMAEAEALCDRIAIMRRAALVAVDTLEGLKKVMNQKTLEDIFIELAEDEEKD